VKTSAIHFSSSSSDRLTGWVTT